MVVVAAEIMRAPAAIAAGAAWGAVDSVAAVVVVAASVVAEEVEAEEDAAAEDAAEEEDVGAKSIR